MSKSAAKDHEKHILTLVYDEREYHEISLSEQPDFRITHLDESHVFGVEITELFMTETEARLEKIPTYLGELIADEKFRGKQDKLCLSVQDFKVYNKDNIYKQTVRGVIREAPTLQSYRSKITETIRVKNQKLEAYAADLTHVNLLVYDSTDIMRLFDAADIYSTVMDNDLISELLATNFREIFFVTCTKDKKHVFMPLKASVLLADLYFFNNLMALSFQNHPADDERDQITAFGTYMILRSQNAHFVEYAGTLSVSFGNDAVTICDGQVSAWDSFDIPLTPINIGKASKWEALVSSQDFKDAEQEFRDTHSFSLDSSIPVLHTVKHIT